MSEMYILQYFEQITDLLTDADLCYDYISINYISLGTSADVRLQLESLQVWHHQLSSPLRNDDVLPLGCVEALFPAVVALVEALTSTFSSYRLTFPLGVWYFFLWSSRIRGEVIRAEIIGALL